MDAVELKSQSGSESKPRLNTEPRMAHLAFRMPANSDAVGAKKARKMSKKQRRRNEDIAGPLCADRSLAHANETKLRALGRKESERALTGHRFSPFNVLVICDNNLPQVASIVPLLPNESEPSERVISLVTPWIVRSSPPFLPSSVRLSAV